jgi:hypothetical protein
MVNDADRAVFEALGAHLGHLASIDLARRVKEGALDPKARADSRRARKQALTADSSSRWAGTITRNTEDSCSLAKRNLTAEKVSLEARIKKISSRVKVPAGDEKAGVAERTLASRSGRRSPVTAVSKVPATRPNPARPPPDAPGRRRTPPDAPG